MNCLSLYFLCIFKGSSIWNFQKKKFLCALACAIEWSFLNMLVKKLFDFFNFEPCAGACKNFWSNSSNRWIIHNRHSSATKWPPINLPSISSTKSTASFQMKVFSTAVNHGTGRLNRILGSKSIRIHMNTYIKFCKGYLIDIDRIISTSGWDRKCNLELPVHRFSILVALNVVQDDRIFERTCITYYQKVDKTGEILRLFFILLKIF